MTWEQGTILAVLACTLAVFVWDRWRYDVVAITSLMVSVLLGLVAPETAFSGFSNPAVITVAAVLVISRALARSGALDALAGRLIDATSRPFHHLASFCLLGALLSAFMNNVGALALLMPVALSAARRHRYSPALLLMPLSFATLLGGMITLIGTPPNLLISAFRAEATGERFLLFDFAPTGLALSAAGIAYLLLVGRRFLPVSRGARAGGRVRGRGLCDRGARGGRFTAGRPRGRPGSRPRSGIVVHGVIRDGRRVFGRLQEAVLRADDILLLQAGTAALERTSRRTGWSWSSGASGNRPTARSSA